MSVETSLSPEHVEELLVDLLRDFGSAQRSRMDLDGHSEKSPCPFSARAFRQVVLLCRLRLRDTTCSRTALLATPIGDGFKEGTLRERKS